MSTVMVRVKMKVGVRLLELPPLRLQLDEFTDVLQRLAPDLWQLRVRVRAPRGARG